MTGSRGLVATFMKSFCAPIAKRAEDDPAAVAVTHSESQPVKQIDDVRLRPRQNAIMALT
jgi:hypothetical protein